MRELRGRLLKERCAVGGLGVCYDACREALPWMSEGTLFASCFEFEICGELLLTFDASCRLSMFLATYLYRCICSVVCSIHVSNNPVVVSLLEFFLCQSRWRTDWSAVTTVLAGCQYFRLCRTLNVLGWSTENAEAN